MRYLANARVLDVDAGTWSGPSTIAIVDGRIADITAHPPARADDVVDLHGGWVVPGLIDCHVHLIAYTANLSELRLRSGTYLGVQAALRATASVRQGFTRLRDMGGADLGVAMACREQLIAAPHVHFGGPALSQTGGHGDMRPLGENGDGAVSHGLGRVVEGVPELRRAVRGVLREGGTHIKLMLSGGVASPTDPLDASHYSDEEIAAVVDETGRAGFHVGGHCYTPESIVRAVRLGVRSIEHGNLADDATLDLMRGHGAYLVPTLSTYHWLVRDGARLGLPPVSQAKLGGLLEAGLDTLRRAAAKGVPIVLGTDLLDEMHLHEHDEFNLREAIQDPIDVLRSATTVAAELLGITADAGRVQPGLLADLAVYDRDPLDGGVLGDPAAHLRLVTVAGRTVHTAKA